jgi:hypothetical protein
LNARQKKKHAYAWFGEVGARQLNLGPWPVHASILEQHRLAGTKVKAKVTDRIQPLQ